MQQACHRVLVAVLASESEPMVLLEPLVELVPLVELEVLVLLVHVA